MKRLAIAAVVLASSLALGATRSPSLFPAAGGPVELGAIPPGLSGAAPADCASCHAEIAAEWAGSAHARAWTNPIFQAEYRGGPSAFCRGCHAPLVAAELWALASPAVRAGQPARTWSALPDLLAFAQASRGIDCAVCHVREGRVLGPRGHGGDEHASRREAKLAAGAFCGACHQFDFPAAEPGRKPRHHPDQPQQNTLAEWAQSRYAGSPCQQCHMPAVRTVEPAGEVADSVAAPRRPGGEAGAAAGSSHRNHTFHIFDDPALLSRAVKVTVAARRRGETVRVTAQIAGAEIGHAFPTGDMFRQAVLTVRAGSSSERAVLRRYFAQTMTADGRGHLLGQVEDTRVPAPGAGPAARFELELRVPAATEPREAPELREVTWTLELLRLDPEDARKRGLVDAQIRALVQSGRAPIRR